MSEGLGRTAIIAIGRNEGERLKRCLRSVRDAAGPVIYVDSASTDGSAQAAADLGAKVVALDVSLPFTAARARASGVDALPPGYTPDFLFFVDGDCEVERGFIGAAQAFLDRHSAYAVVCGRRRERFPDASRYNELLDREWNTPVGDAEACGGDAVFRYAAYRQANGFDPAMLAGEEPELCTRLASQGWRIRRIDVPMTVHDAAMMRWSQWWRRAVRSGMGYLQVWLRTRAKGGGLYRRQLARALFWAGLLPMIGIVLAFAIHPFSILIWPFATAANYLRQAARIGWFPAWLSVAGKYAELTGIARYGWRMLLNRSRSTVHYK